MIDESPLAGRVSGYFSSESGDIRYIFSPFIQKETIEHILPNDGMDTIVITRWRKDDLRSGVSDPHVFNFCKKHGYTLKINQRLHAKTYSWDLEEGLVGSANLTDAGMGRAQVSNIEVLAGPLNLPLEVQMKLRRAERDAQLVTKDGFEAAVEIYQESPSESETDQEGIDLGNQPEYLISSLPATEDPDVVISVLAVDRKQTLSELSSTSRRCVLHDITTYALTDLDGLPESEVRVKMQQRFENHPFIKAIIDQMDPDIYFGEMKEFVQHECVDVPTPSRRELTENIQILYSWFPKLSPNRFEHDIPGAQSERLRDTNYI